MLKDKMRRCCSSWCFETGVTVNGALVKAVNGALVKAPSFLVSL